MNNSTQPQSNDENQSYDSLSLEELKQIAQERQVIPEGNKTKKDTWISALTENDRVASESEIDLSKLEILEPSSETEIAQEPSDKYTSESHKPGESKTVKPISEPEIDQNPNDKEAQDYILENIVTALDQRRIDVDRLQINLDGQNIFKMNQGDVANSTVTQEQTELIKQALNDPASFKGSLKITNGGQVLLHVKDGQVIRDGLNITKPNTKVEISSAPEDLYDKYAENVNSKGLKATKDVASAALAAGIEPKQVKEIIESKDSAYADLQASSGKNSADRALNKIIASAEAEIKLKQQKQPTRNRQRALSR